MSYDNLSSVSQNVLKFYQQLTGEERRVPFIFGRNNHNVLVMEIDWTDVLTVILVILSIKNPIFRHIKSNNSGTAKVKIGKNERDPPLFTGKLLIKFQNILRNTTQGSRGYILVSCVHSNTSYE
jgi:hypothetical protein